MKKLKQWIAKQKNRLDHWKEWRRYTLFNPFDQVLILFGLKRSVSFDRFMTIEDYSYFAELNKKDRRSIKSVVKQIEKEEKKKERKKRWEHAENQE